MKGKRESHPIWIVARIEQDERGLDDGYVDCGSFWNEADAIAERDRLDAENTDPAARFVVDRNIATAVYPSDELPPWIDDPDRLKRRGYEMPPSTIERSRVE